MQTHTTYNHKYNKIDQQIENKKMNLNKQTKETKLILRFFIFVKYI